MSTLFTQADYDALAALVFHPDYPGNATARGVVEAPAGDPAARDSGKRYAHVATKYLLVPDSGGQPDMTPGEYTLYRYLILAHHISLDIAIRSGVPAAFMPAFAYGALRVLEYPAGEGGHLHTDFDLFAVNLWRNVPNPGLGGAPYHIGEIGELVGLGTAEPHYVAPLPVPQMALVYFAIPDHAAVLPGCGADTVGEWLGRRIARSRYET